MLLGAVLFLVCLGLVMVYSATSARAVIAGRDPAGQAQRQLIYAVIGFGVMALVARTRPVVFRRVAPMMVAASVVMLVAVLILPPPIAPTINGAQRWLVFGSIQLQPSEIAKVALILWMASVIARNPKVLAQPKGLVPFMVVTGLLAALVVVEPDLGTASIIGATGFALAFVGGAPVRKLGTIAVSVAALVVMMIIASPYQRSRVTSFLDPWANPTGEAFQNVQAQIAIGSGGVFGRGLGNSIQKNNYLPEAQTDMIGAIIGEELGLVGLAAVIAAFILIGLAGYRIAFRARDLNQRLLATGVVSMICLQGGINLAQVLGAFPITGVPLPFVSAGGTSLVVFLAGVGILINVSRQGAHAAARRARPSRDEGGDRSRGNGGARETRPRDRRRLAS